MRKKKIIIYIHQCIIKGGVEKVFYNLINNLPMELYDITVLSVMGYLKDDFDSNLYPNYVKRHCLMWDELSKESSLRRIRQKIHNRIFPIWSKFRLKFQRFDVAIAAQEGMYADFVLKNIRAKKKLLWIHNDIAQCHWTQYYWGTTKAERQCYEKFDRIVCVSQAVANSVETVLGAMSNLAVCYNPIDTNEIDDKLKEPLPSRPSVNPWFVCVGRLCYQKAYDRLIEVCHRLNNEGYKYDITILGEGEDRSMLEQMILDRGIENIHLIGNTDNPFIYMKQADWLLLLSRHEGFGMVLHEAAYCQIPIIATNVCGARELLGDSEYGLVVENSPAAIYRVLKDVLDNPEMRQQYVEAVRRRSYFVDLQQRIKNIQKVIED